MSCRIFVACVIGIGVAAALPATADDRDRRPELVAVGELGGPVGEALGERFELRRVSPTASRDVARELAGAAAVVVDLGRLDERSLAPTGALVDVARRAGIPVVALDASRDRLARMVGLGVDGAVVAIGLTDDGRTPELRVLATEAPGRDAARALADRVAGLVADARASRTKSGGLQRINYEAWVVGTEITEWTPYGNPGGTDQVATMNVFYQVELVANSELNQFPNQKYLKVRALGSGMNPGQLPPVADQDADRERGWYQEKMRVELEPQSSPPGLALMAVAPGTTDVYSTYSETTGWEVGVDSEGQWGLTFSGSQTSSTTFQNFRVDSVGAGDTAAWRYSMSSTGGADRVPYGEPMDLVYEDPFGGCPLFRTCLREVNEHSVSTIGLQAEAVWQAPLTFEEVVDFHLVHEQEMVHIRYDSTDCVLFVCSDLYEWFVDSRQEWYAIAVDFAAVQPYGPDADGDGIPDWYEGSRNTDGTAPADFQDLDSDDDGLFDFDEWIDDPDADGLENYRDTDSDDDGFLDSQEAAAGTDPYSEFSRPDLSDATVGLGRAAADGADTTVPLGAGFTDPVVILGPPTRHDADPGVLRLSSVSPSGFDVRFQEWSYLDGVHGSEDFSWFAADAGRYGTGWGSIWEVGTADVAGTGAWQRVTFTAPMSDVPVVVATLQTDAGGQAVAVRVRNVDASGFDVALFPEQGSPPLAAVETVGFLAADSARGSDVVMVGGEETPWLVQSFDGDHRPTELLSAFVMMQEETSADGETDHGLEPIGALAIGTELFVQDQDATDLDPVALRIDFPEYGGAFEVGLVRGVVHEPWLFVPYGKQYANPIVVASSTRPGDDAAGEVRVSPVVRTPSLQRFWRDGGFAVRFQPFLPPDWAPGVCDAVDNSPRDIRYVVSEMGAGEVGGLTWESGSIYSDSRAGDGEWDTVLLGAGFGATPSFFANLQNEKCGIILGAEISSPSATSLALSTSEQNDYCANCTFQWDPEEDWNEVGWLALQPGQGVTVDGRLIQVTSDEVRIAYGSGPPEPPTARFRWSPVQPAPGEPVQFTDTSTGNPTQWSWSFGDGTPSSSEQNPVHVFTSPGTYVVFQAVTSNLGLDTTTSAIVIGAPAGGLFSDGFESGDLGAWSSASP